MTTPILLNAGQSERGWHRIEGASRCLRLFAWREAGMLPWKQSAPLVKGSLLHIGLAHVYARKRCVMAGEDPDIYLSPDDAVRALSDIEGNSAQSAHDTALWHIHVQIVLDAIRAYEARWRHCSWRPVMVEEEFRAQIPRIDGNGTFLFTQRADLVVEDLDGKYWIVDHKSCYRIESKTLRQHILDGQFLGYQIFGRMKWGQKFGGVIVNRVKLTDPNDFDRTTLEPAPDAVKRFAKNLALQEHMTDMFKGKPPEEWPAVYSNQTCWGKYGQCAAYQLCQWGKP